MERLLDALRDDPLPPSAVDVERALSDGRHRVRRRRLTSAVAAGWAVLAVAGGVSVAVNRPNGGTPPAVQPSTAAPGPTASAMPARAPATFDPTRRYAGFGWLPDGLTELQTATRADQLSLRASPPINPASKEELDSAIQLRIVPAGHDIALLDPADFATEPGVTASWPELTQAKAVNGRPARWNDKAIAAAQGAALRWEYAPNAWAEVIVQGRAAGADARATARRVAQTVRYGVDEPIRLPFKMRSMPAPLRPMAVSVSTSTAAATSWSAQVSYGSGKRTVHGDWPLTVIVIPRPSRTGDGAVIGDPDTTLDGHPARRSSGADGGVGLQLYDVQGLYLELATHDPATTRQLHGGLDQVFRGMKLYPDPRNWQ